MKTNEIPECESKSHTLDCEPPYFNDTEADIFENLLKTNYGIVCLYYDSIHKYLIRFDNEIFEFTFDGDVDKLHIRHKTENSINTRIDINLFCGDVDNVKLSLMALIIYLKNECEIVVTLAI